jgi:hypothetical protein
MREWACSSSTLVCICISHFTHILSHAYFQSAELSKKNDALWRCVATKNWICYALLFNTQKIMQNVIWWKLGLTSFQMDCALICCGFFFPSFLLILIFFQFYYFRWHTRKKKCNINHRKLLLVALGGKNQQQLDGIIIMWNIYNEFFFSFFLFDITLNWYFE